MTARLLIALATIHMGIIAGTKPDKEKGRSAVAPKTTIVKTGMAFYPRTSIEENELLASTAVRYPFDGEDVSRFPVVDLVTGEIKYPVIKSAEQIASEAAEAAAKVEEAEKLRLEQAEKSKQAAIDKQAALDKKQQEADDLMRANAKKAEDAAAAKAKKEADAAEAKAKKEADDAATKAAADAEAKAKADADAAAKQAEADAAADTAAKEAAAKAAAEGTGEKDDVV